MDHGVTRGEEFQKFDALMRKLIIVPKKELDKRVAAFKNRRRDGKTGAHPKS